MVLGLFFLFLCESTETLTNVTVEAKPDYPVAEGQTVNLHCSSVNVSVNVSYSWECLKNQTWKLVSNSTDLSLTKPNESGIYRCSARYQSTLIVSSNHTVYIVAILPTDKLGIPAFVISLLSLIISLAIVSWLGWQAHSVPLPISTTTAKDFPGPEKVSKGGFPQIQGDGDEYINYSRTNQAYSDLDPTSMNNVYSTLS
ncbi:uncharacterized protein [Channa argus]|uniref:uncharacterized protein isoform X2 n=1 Tax=Channa argus TaxID=215402 RepID=UPI0035222410